MLLIGLNKMETVAIIIIEAVGDDQVHGAVGGSTVLDPDSGASESGLLVKLKKLSKTITRIFHGFLTLYFFKNHWKK